MVGGYALAVIFNVARIAPHTFVTDVARIIEPTGVVTGRETVLLGRRRINKFAATVTTDDSDYHRLDLTE